MASRWACTPARCVYLDLTRPRRRIASCTLSSGSTLTLTVTTFLVTEAVHVFDGLLLGFDARAQGLDLQVLSLTLAQPQKLLVNDARVAESDL